MKRLIVVVLVCVSSLLAHDFTHDASRDFLASFINHYEVNPEGRYTHEYHPFLLEWTSKSLDALERHVRDNGINCDNRIVIMGYEENAIQQYYPNFKRPKIDDEATRKNYSGWSQRLRNRFGFMSGFVMKDVEEIKAHWSHETPCIFEHIDAHYLPIFQNRATLFHEHAFGTALPLIYQTYHTMGKKVQDGKTKEVLEGLADFWHTLYAQAFTVGNKELAGTQDVLFSIAYAQYLMRSDAALRKFFIGPDITYPIEVTSKQDAFATLHAQHFVTTFTKQLVPVNNGPTAYVFCSFVDGVGKSTMLGNIKNWMKHGNDIQHFDHVDNSSSQLADMFQYDDNVYIVDLPAQMSHFTYKPDGFVFVDMRTYVEPSLQQELTQYVQANRALLKIKAQDIEHDALLKYDSENCLHAFIKNIHLLNKQHNFWVPFEYKGVPYLFQDRGPLEIRSLTSLSHVKSEGLKNIEADQMIFSKGVRFPLMYSYFCDDLISKLKSKNIREIVFVDFLSMYPRSSRENIRINYLMQQMARINSEFVPHKTLYKDFVSGGELLHALQDAHNKSYISSMLYFEAMMRNLLFKRLIEGESTDIDGHAIDDVTAYVREHMQEFHDQYGAYTQKLVHKKITKELDHLERTYGLSKAFMNVQHFSAVRVASFGLLLRKLFSYDVLHDILSDSWRDKGSVGGFECQSEGEHINAVLETSTGVKLNGLWVMHEACKNGVIITPVARMLRACWYGQILNMLSSHREGDKIILDALLVPGIPVCFDRGNDGHFYVTQQIAELWPNAVGQHMRTPFKNFNLSSFKPSSYVLVNDLIYRSDWDSKTTSKGLMGFDSPGMDHKENSVQGYSSHLISEMGRVVQKYQREYGQSTVLTTSMALERLQNTSYWYEELRELREAARRNGPFLNPWNKAAKKQADAKDKTKEVKVTPTFGPMSNVRWCAPHLLETMRLMVRLLATLEMVVKDPDSDVVVRYGNRDDFKSALKILEMVVLPHHCSIFFPQPLFDDYDMVEPYPSWEWWDRC